MVKLGILSFNKSSMNSISCDNSITDCDDKKE